MIARTPRTLAFASKVAVVSRSQHSYIRHRHKPRFSIFESLRLCVSPNINAKARRRKGRYLCRHVFCVVVHPTGIRKKAQFVAVRSIHSTTQDSDVKLASKRSTKRLNNIKPSDCRITSTTLERGTTMTYKTDARSNSYTRFFSACILTITLLCAAAAVCGTAGAHTHIEARGGRA